MNHSAAKPVRRPILFAIAVILSAWFGWAVVNAGSEPITGVWVLAYSDYDPPEIPAEFGGNPKLHGIVYPTRMEFHKDGTWLWQRRNKSSVATGNWRRCRGAAGGEGALSYECVLDGKIVARIECTRSAAEFSSGPTPVVPTAEFPVRFARPGNFLSEIPARVRSWIMRKSP